MNMQNWQPSSGRWTCCESRSTLASQAPSDFEMVETESPNSWGYVRFEPDLVIPVAYADIGLQPLAVRLGEQVLIGIDELLVSYDCASHSTLFKYRMPTTFHEFVRFDQHEFIVRDEVGFVGISYSGVERWVFCVDMISSYVVDQSLIVGVTVEGERFRFRIPNE